MRITSALIMALMAISLLSCSDKPTAPADHTVTFSATVMVTRCPGWSPTLRYSTSTGHAAHVTLTGGNGVSYISSTNANSEVEFHVDTGLYTVTVQTFHMPPTTASPIHLTGDSSGLQFQTLLNYSPADSMMALFFYPNRDTTDARTNELETLRRLNSALDGMLDVSHIRRSVPDSESWNGWIWYDGIATGEVNPPWFIKQTVDQVISNSPGSYPYGFTLEPYAIICFGAPQR
jgi:hypothetical protein